MEGEGRSHLNIGVPCELSSDSYAIEIVHNGNNSNKLVHEPTASFTADAGGLDVAVRSTILENRAIYLNSNVCDAGLTDAHHNSSQNMKSEDLANLASGLNICLPFAEHISSTSGSSVPHAEPSYGGLFSANDDADDDREGRTLEGQHLSCKRKYIQGSNGPSLRGSATFPIASTVELDQRADNTDMRLGYEHNLASVESAESSHRTIRMRNNTIKQHGISLYNQLFSGNSGIHPCLRPSHQSSTFVVTPNQELASRLAVQAPVPHGRPQSLSYGLAVQVDASQNQPHSPVARPTVWAPDFQSMIRLLVSRPAVPITEPLQNLAPLSYPIHVPNMHTVELNEYLSSRVPGNSSSTILGGQSSASREQITSRSNTREREQINSRSNTRDSNNSTTVPPIVVPPSISNWHVPLPVSRNMSNRSTDIPRSAPSTSQAGTHAVVHSNVVCQPSTSQGSYVTLPRNDNSTLQGRGYQSVANFPGNQRQIHGLRPVVESQTNRVPALSVPVRSFAAGSRLSEIRSALEAFAERDGLQAVDTFISANSIVLNAADRRDRFRGMRLDIDGMSYEELLALEEKIGNVNTGLEEETILKHLKQKKYSSSIAVEDRAREPCCVCQEEYVVDEFLGILGCGHDFHADCIKQWLKQKNKCPICKTTAIVTRELGTKSCSRSIGRRQR